MTKLQAIVLSLISQEPLAKKHYAHELTGNYVNRRECHIEPDWLLIYKWSQTVLFLNGLAHTQTFFNKP